MEYGILGSLQVREAGSPVEIAPRRLRMLLALLVINANQVVTTDRILEELWGDEADGKENALWVYISRLRSALGDEEALVTRDHGYSLIADEDDIDVRRFESTLKAGRALLKQDPERASALLDEALGLWRGQALEEFTYEEFARSEISRLEELRMAALEDRIDANLRCGLAGELVSELEVLHHTHPTRERLVSQLMLALYRSGRQPDALRAFEAYRIRLGEEFGLEPSPELRRLEEQVLLHDSRIRGRERGRTSAVRSPTRPALVNPFKGLRAFYEDDSTSFFGRDRLVVDVIRRLESGTSLIGLVGPSGSGKSSLARAGVIPALRKGAIEGSDRWVIAQMVPGAHPFAELEAGLLRASLDAPDSLTDQLADRDTGILRAVLRVLPDEHARLVLFIDQFEELFTLVDDEARTADFLEGLLLAARDPRGRLKVIFTLRADFYDRPLSYPEFGAEMGEGVVNVVPLSPDELEAAARRPAEETGVTLEPALLAALLTDVLGEPGGLPLFQYALTELFDRRADGTLTLASYTSMGGVVGALGRRADAIYDDLDHAQQATTRQLFLRLVTIADRGEWGRRRVPASEILSLDIDVIALQTVIDAFVEHRLLTLDRDSATAAPTVEVAHEALLTNWGRLQKWIEDAREDLKRHDALTAALNEWIDAGREPDYLLDGARLDAYEHWADATDMRLTGLEQDFIRSSRARREEIEHDRSSRESHARRSTRRMRVAIGALSVLTAIAAFVIVQATGDERPTVAFFGFADDQSWNANIVSGLDRAAREFDLDRDNARPTADPSSEFRAIATSGADLVVTDAAPTFFAADVFVDLPEIHFAVIDAVVDSPNVTSILFANEQGGFLAGVAAAMKSETGIVGFVGGFRLATIEAFRAGFEAGAHHVDPRIEVLATYIEERPEMGIAWSAFARPDLGEERATALYERGADVVFHAAGYSGFGVFDAAERQSEAQGRHLWAIGIDNDQWYSADVAQRQHILTSIIKRGDVAAFLATKEFIEDGFTPGVREIGLAEEAFDFSTEGDGLTGTMIAQLESVASDIAEGRVGVPVLPSGDLLIVPRGDLDAFASFGTGTYTMEVLGTPVAFTVEGSWSTRWVVPGLFVISTRESSVPGDDDIVFVRPTNLIDHSTGEPTVAARDLDQWLDGAPDALVVSETVPTSVGGLDGVTFDAVVADDADCAVDDRRDCIAFLTFGSEQAYFDKGILYRVAWLDHPDGPIAIVAGTTESDPSWFDTARDVIDTVEFG